MPEIQIRRIPSIPALTGLRFFAALAVLLFHYGASYATKSGIPHPLSVFLHNGFLGVSLFFVLSGFILTYVHHDERIDGEFFKRFYFARFARIYPVYLLALCLALVTLKEPLSATDTVRVLAMVQSWTLPTSSDGYLWLMQAWTLSIELVFYLCFPAALWAVRYLNFRSTLLFAGTLAILIVASGSPSITPATDFLPFESARFIPVPVFRLLEFFYGIALCRLLCLAPSRGAENSVVSICLVLSIVSIMSMEGAGNWVALSTVLAGLLMVDLSRSESIVGTFLASKLLVLLGGASYALYLLQGPVRAACDAFIPHPFDRFINPLLVVPPAILVFLYWEQPARRILNAWYRIAHRGISREAA